MANLAIRGHATRGKEVIEILEMLGGVNKNKYTAYKEDLYFYISPATGIICCDLSIVIKLDSYYDIRPYARYTLEEFLEKYPYKVGDKVIYKSEVFPLLE